MASTIDQPPVSQRAASGGFHVFKPLSTYAITANEANVDISSYFFAVEVLAASNMRGSSLTGKMRTAWMSGFLTQALALRLFIKERGLHIGERPPDLLQAADKTFGCMLSSTFSCPGLGEFFGSIFPLLVGHYESIFRRSNVLTAPISLINGEELFISEQLGPLREYVVTVGFPDHIAALAAEENINLSVFIKHILDHYNLDHEVAELFSWIAFYSVKTDRGSTLSNNIIAAVKCRGVSPQISSSNTSGLGTKKEDFTTRRRKKRRVRRSVHRSSVLSPRKPLCCTI